MAKVLEGTAAWTIGIGQHVHVPKLGYMGCWSRAKRRLTLWCGKVDDVSVALEHVDLLNGLDGLDVDLLESLLELLVVAAGAGRSPLHLPPGGALATISHVRQPFHRI